MLKNKVIIITGGAGLLGSAFVETILQNQGIPVIADLDVKKSQILKTTLQTKYPNQPIETFPLDITNKESANQLIQTITKKYHHIDALVNNAYPRNKNYGRKFFDVEYSDFCQNLNINLGGYFLMMQQFGKYFQSKKQGNIINIASIYGVIPPRFEVYQDLPMTMPVEYAAIKAGLIHLSKYVAKYFKGMNIRVNTISPGGILADQDPKFLQRYNQHALNKGMLDPKDLQGTLLFLLSEHSTFMNGQNLIIDDGWTL